MVVMAAEVDRSGLFKEIQAFSQRKLKKVETKVTSGSGEVLTEKRGAKGVQTIKSCGIQGSGYVVDNKPDLQVGLIIPGLLISSQDVAQDKKTLETYAVTHILNLAYGVANAFEDDYNYKKFEILDVPETDIRKYFDECYEFIDEARHYGNCLVHCNAGVSRCTAICTAYLMYKEKMNFTDALNTVREARPFCKPNDGFMKQLQEYSDELRGGSGLKEANVDDAFTARQRAEIEAEKAAISGSSSVKNKLKEFGATLNAVFAQRAKYISPIKLPLKKKSVPIDTKAPPNVKAPPPPPPPPGNIKAPPPPPLPEQKRYRQEPPKARPEPLKVREEPKKLIINKEMNNRSVKEPKSPTVDETPISVKAFRKNFELNNKPEIPKVHKTPATPTPKTNAVTNNSPWNRSQSPSNLRPTPEDSKESKKKIIIRQRSKEGKEVTEEQPKRRSTKDLVDAIERVNSPTSGQSSGNTPYNQRRRQTTQLVDTNANSNNDFGNKQPIRRRNREIVNEVPAPPPPPQQPVSRTIKLVKQSSASPSPAGSTPQSSNRNSPQPPVSHSPSPTPFGPQDGEPSKMVFGRVRPPRLSLTGRTLSQASQTLQDVSNKVANNDSTTSSLSGQSASNSRSESPVLSAVGDNRYTKTTQSVQSKSPSKEPSVKAIQLSAQQLTNSAPNAKSVPNCLEDKRTAISSLNSKPNTSNRFKKSCSPSSSLGEDSSDEELVEKTSQPKITSTLTMQLKPNTKQNITKLNDNYEEPQKNDLPLTEPSNDNRFNSKRVPLGKTSGQQSFEKNKTGLNRSSSAQILKLIKSNTKADLGLDRVAEEDDEIEALLNELEKEGVENVDWDELNVDYKEVKDIIDNEKTSDQSSDESSDDDDDSDDDEAVHMIINRQAPAQESDDDFEVVDDDDDDEDDENSK